MAVREGTRTPVIGEVWFRRGKVIDQGTDAQRYAWANAAPPGHPLICRIVRPHVEAAAVVYVDYVQPAARRAERMPLERFLLEWEPMTRERT